MSECYLTRTPSGAQKEAPTRSVIRFCALLWIIALLGLAGLAYGQSVDFTLNTKGISSLTYNGHQFIGDSSFQGDFCLYGPTTTFQQSDGTTYNGSTSFTSSMDGVAKKITLTFAWGTATCTYSKPNSKRINFDVALTNGTSDTLIAASGKLLIFTTPTSSPNAYDPECGDMLLGSMPRWASFAVQSGAVLVDLSTTGKMALCIDDPAMSSNAVGGLSQYNGDNRFDVNWKVLNPIAPGATGKFKASLRFGDSNSKMTGDAAGLANDTYQRLDAQYPCQFNWTDRRLIGQDYLSSQPPHPEDGENPRGWFNNDDTINITTQAGLADFQTRMIAHTTDHIVQLTNCDAQGVIIWDIEGQQMYHAISYVGDPDMMDTVAPEMNFKGTHDLCVADEIFDRYRDAGFKVGICIRPQEYVSDGAGGYMQINAADPGQEVLEDVTYAYERWGCTIFYIDSTIDNPYGGNPLPGTPLLERVMKKYPDFLFICENQTPKYYGYGAPYEQTDNPNYSRGTPSYRVEMYQGAATALALRYYQTSWYTDIMNSLKRGDILTVGTWYSHDDREYALDLYDDLGARPSVSITSPSDYSASVNPSSISVSATANGNGKTLQKVDFYAGSVLVGTDSSSPYTCSWTNFTPGNNYCLYAKATTTDSCSAVSLPVHVKIAPTYEQVGSTLAGPYATPNSVASDTVFSSTGDIPTELTIQNGVIPDQCIEYTLSISGVTGYTSVGGNSGLALFAGSTPSESDGLFTGVYHYDNSVSRGALADDLAESSTPYGPQKTVSSSYTVTVDVTDGVINTYLNGVHWQSYAPTAADMANWAGQTKFATFHSGPGTLWQYAKASISNVKFYKPSKVATPTFSPTPGTYTSRSKIVTISCATSGATIRYTTDGSEPLPDSTQYTGSITITGSCMIKAKAFKPGYKDSDTASGTYTISRVWTQTGSTIAGPYWTPDATGGGFSSTIDMPSAVTIQGGAIPDMKVEYTLTLTGISGYGDQRNGNSGLAMFLSSTPSSSDGAFTGVSHPNYSVNHGAIVGNAAAMPDPDPWSTSFNDSSVYTVAVEIAGGVATTTVTDVNCRYYSVTSTDVSNWSGQTKFAAFHSSPGVNWDYARAGISNIKFYTGETTVSWVQVGDTITTEYATPDPYPNGYSSTAFSSTVDMPSELAVSGGVVPDFKVTYDVNLIWHSAWGAQYGGNSGMALYQSSTPSATGGLYCGLNGQWDGSWYSTGAFTGNAANVSGGNGYYSIPGTWPALTKSVTVEKIGSTVTTTVTGMDNRAYTVTSTDISNWAGKSKFAAFRGPSGQNWMYNAVGVQNITFYRGE